MIKEITIESFKAISSRTAVPLCEFNVVIGRNGSGKSSIIEAIEWLSDCVSFGAAYSTKQFRRIDDVIYAGHKHFDITVAYDPKDLSVGNEVNYYICVNSDNGIPNISKESLIYKQGSNSLERIKTEKDIREYALSLKGEISKQERELLRKRAQGDKLNNPLESILYALDKLEAQQLSASNNQDETLIKIIDPKVDRGGMLLRDFLERAVFLALNPKSIGDFSDIMPDITSKKLLDKQGLNLARLLSELDRESLDILIEKVAFITGRTSGCNIHEPQGPADRRYFELTEDIGGVSISIPGWMLSEGTRRITAILALLLHETPPTLLCIEEIENGLDPWTIKFVLEELSAAAIAGTQIIVTTHSPYLLNHVSLENILFVDRQNETISISSGDKMPTLSKICEHMGTGDMYVSRYLHDASKEKA